MSNQLKLKHILLSDIVPDHNQPRKYFDIQKQTELEESIRTYGVKQPILVRPHLTNRFMIVTGERRYRACVSIPEITSIPAMIEILSDDEALEIQITENLQRSDVSPMEEAAAFLSLHQTSGMDIAEIAARIGKSASYVAQRIKLNALIPDLQEMLDYNKITLSAAYILCKMDPEVQAELYKEETTKWNGTPIDWKVDDDFVFSVSKRPSAFERLDRARFDLADADLYPLAGACTTCVHNSQNQPLLFEEEHLCYRSSCYAIKKKHFFIRSLEQLEPTIPVLQPSAYRPDEVLERAKLAKEIGLSLIDDYEIISMPDMPAEWDDYRDDWFDDKADGEAISEEDLQECKEGFESDMADYTESLAEYQEDIKGAIDAFDVFSGTIVKIKNKMPNGTGSARVHSSEIVKILLRERRAKELDAEKIYAATRELIFRNDDREAAMAEKDQDDTSDYSLGYWKNNVSYVTLSKRLQAWTAALIYDEISYSAKREFDNKYFADDFTDQQKFDYFINQKYDLPKLAQYFIAHKVFSNSGPTHEHSSLLNMISMDVARQILGESVTKIELKHQEKAAQRSERVEKRLAEIKTKIKASEEE